MAEIMKKSSLTEKRPFQCCQEGFAAFWTLGQTGREMALRALGKGREMAEKGGIVQENYWRKRAAWARQTGARLVTEGCEGYFLPRGSFFLRIL
jgi:hypothetical protein